MVLGQSMESSAGDPTQAGNIINAFFYDPFVAGDKAAHANLFYAIMKENPQIECYLLNTGGIGEGEHYHDISLHDTMGILDSVLRGGLEDWIMSSATGLLTPRSVRTVDSSLMHPEELYTHSEWTIRQNALNMKRAEILESYPGLNNKVMNAFSNG